MMECLSDENLIKIENSAEFWAIEEPYKLTKIDGISVEVIEINNRLNPNHFLYEKLSYSEYP